MPSPFVDSVSFIPSWPTTTEGRMTLNLCLFVFFKDRVSLDLELPVCIRHCGLELEIVPASGISSATKLLLSGNLVSV